MYRYIQNQNPVEPYQPYSFTKAELNLKFNVYQENDEYLCIPKYYGINKIGPPSQNKEIKGAKIKIKFFI
jgi:hypothetical protein